jgi:hypothetical protein
MNVNSMINMVMRMIMRRVMRSGVNAGIGAVGKRMNKGKADSAAPDTKATQKRASSTMKIARRIGRM